MNPSVFLSSRFALLAFAGLSGSLAAAPFTAGNIAVLRAESSSANNTTASIVEISPTSTTPSTPIQALAIDGSTLPNALRFSGSAGTTGYLANSDDRSLLTFTGHNSNVTTGNANALTARGVGTFNPSGTFALGTTYTGTTGNQTRCATTLNGTNWYIADQAGLYTNFSSFSSPAGNFRGIKSFGGGVYTGQQDGNVTNIQVGTLNATTGGVFTGLPGLSNNSSFQDFHLIQSGDSGTAYDVLYVVSATTNSAGTLSKYSLVSGTWIANGSYTTSFGGFGLAATDNGNGALLYVSTGTGSQAANSVLKIADTAGYNATIAITTANNVTLYTAPTGTTVKGVAFAPATARPDLAVTVAAPANGTTGTSFSYTLTALNNASVAASGVSLRFTLPIGLTFVSATGSSGFTGSQASGVVTFSGGSLAGYGSATLSVAVTAASAATYTAAIGSVVIDPLNLIVEGNEVNNSSTAAASTIVVTPNSPPAFTLQPAAATSVAYGATTTLTVSASGNPVPTFQWYVGNSGNTSSPVSGETSASFTTPPITANTSYWVRASNNVSTANSNTAAITVVLSSNSSLSGLSLGSGSLSPAFASATTSYATDVAGSATTLTITPTVSNASATVQVRVNGGSYTATPSGSPSSPLALAIGDNVIQIKVIAQDGVTNTVYTLTVTRPAPSVLVAGDLLFTAMNSDEDGWAMVALRDIPANSRVFFTDNEWDGTAFNAGEGYYQWLTGATIIPAGTVIRFLSVDLATLSASEGTLSRATVAGSTAYGLSQIEDSIYAYVADSVTSAPTFLAAICNTSFGTPTAGSLSNTGISLGNAAIQTGIAAGSDFAEYTASRSGQSSFASYLTAVSSIANWTDSGEGTFAATVPNTTPFTITSATPSVNLSVSASTGSEAGTTAITVTLTANAPVTGNQSVALGVSGTGITSGDYSLSATSISIPSGNFTGSVTFTVLNDILLEGPETATLSISSPTSGIVLGVTPTRTISIIDNETSVDLSTYVRVGRYNLPEPTRTSAPANNSLCKEASGVAYNWDTGTLFIVGDSGKAVTQVSKTGALINTMTLASGGSPQGTEFYDTEGITYIGGGKFVFVEERDRQLVQFTYVAGSTLTRAAAKTVDLGTFDDNNGIEGVSYDPLTGGFVCIKEQAPEGLFQTGVNFTAGTATNGSPTTLNSINLFDPALANLSDFADVYALSNLPSLGGQSREGNLLVLSQADGKIVNLDRSGIIASSLQLVSDAGNPLTIDDQHHEGLTMDRDGILYVVSENGGGDNEHPQLWVFAPAPNPGKLAITEVAPWSGSSPVGADWFEVTNTGGLAVDLSGWKMDDSSDSLALAASLSGITSIAAGESVIFLETSDLPAAKTAFLANWFGANAPAGLRFGSYSGSGVGLAITDDAVNLYDGNGVRRASISFGTSPVTPLATFDNSGALENPTVSQLSAVGVNGAFAAVNDTNEIGSPGIITVSTPITAWRQLHFNTTANTGLTADGADFDGDGVSNLLEYALGSDPTIASVAQGLSVLPDGLFHDPSSALLSDRLAISFQLDSPNPTDLTYLVQATNDLGTWTPVASKTGSGAWTWLGGGSSHLVLSGSNPITVKVGDVVPSSGNPKRMMRLKVTNP